MTEVERILDQLQRAYDGDAWSGPSLRATLEGVTAEQAVAHPLPDAHSIWEIVLHVAAWMDAVRERIGGDYVRLPADGDWQEVDDTSDAAWTATLAKLENKHQELRSVVAGLSDRQLDEMIGTDRDRETGAGVSRYVTLHGIAQHNLYHAGQIALLKKH